MQSTNFDRTQIEILAERFWHDTCSFGTPGKMPRAGFDRLMAMLLRSTADQGQVVDGGTVIKSGQGIPGQVLDQLWANFHQTNNTSCAKELTFEMLIQGMDKAWKDTHFHLVAARAEYAARNDKSAEERDREDNSARANMKMRPVCNS